LRETFDIYVRAVQESDLETLFTTVTDREEFFFLTSRGKLIASQKEYYKFHQDWFQEEEWEMPVKLLEVHEGKDYGYTTALFYYRQKTASGETYSLDSYFTLIFRREDEMWKVVADVCTPISRYITDRKSGMNYTQEQTQVLNVIKNRRTVRKFKPDPVPKEHIMKILEAAHFAPTAGNQQPWRFLVVQNRKKLDQLKEKASLWYLEKYQQKRNPSEEEFAQVKDVVRRTLENALSAPVYVAVLVDSKAEHPGYILYDGTLAAGYLMIAARGLGYGTGFYTTFFPEDKMRDFFDLPEQYNLICFTPIGIPDSWPEMPEKKKIEELVIFESF
jgi:nitroreductase/ketosteroid isomerase-like protein